MMPDRELEPRSSSHITLSPSRDVLNSSEIFLLVEVGRFIIKS